VSYWRLGTGTTTTAVPDSWGTNTGTASGGFTPGAAGAVAGDAAATFDGTSGKVSMGNPAGLQLWSGDSAGTYYSTGLVVDDNQWHHVVMTYQSGVAGGTKIYLDGAVVFTGTLTVANQTYPLILGAWRNTNGTFAEYFKGTLDEVAVYNTGLTPATVLQHYRAR
jgi:hypothetical protein